MPPTRGPNSLAQMLAIMGEVSGTFMRAKMQVDNQKLRELGIKMEIYNNKQMLARQKQRQEHMAQLEAKREAAADRRLQKSFDLQLRAAREADVLQTARDKRLHGYDLERLGEQARLQMEQQESIWAHDDPIRMQADIDNFVRDFLATQEDFRAGAWQSMEGARQDLPIAEGDFFNSLFVEDANGLPVWRAPDGRTMLQDKTRKKIFGGAGMGNFYQEMSDAVKNFHGANSDEAVIGGVEGERDPMEDLLTYWPDGDIRDAIKADPLLQAQLSKGWQHQGAGSAASGYAKAHYNYIASREDFYRLDARRRRTGDFISSWVGRSDRFSPKAIEDWEEFRKAEFEGQPPGPFDEDRSNQTVAQWAAARAAQETAPRTEGFATTGQQRLQMDLAAQAERLAQSEAKIAALPEGPLKARAQANLYKGQQKFEREKKKKIAGEEFVTEQIRELMSEAYFGNYLSDVEGVVADPQKAARGAILGPLTGASAPLRRALSREGTEQDIKGLAEELGIDDPSFISALNERLRAMRQGREGIFGTRYQLPGTR